MFRYVFISNLETIRENNGFFSIIADDYTDITNYVP